MKKMIKNRMMKTGLLLMLTAVFGGGLQAQELSVPGNWMTFDSYLNMVGKQNLEYLANKLNLEASQAEVVAARVLPDPSLDLEGGYEEFSVGLSYSVEFGKRRHRIALAKSQNEWEELAFEQFFQDMRAQSAELFLDAILQKELLDAKRESFDYMNRLSQSDSLRFISGEITENDARQSRLEAVSLLNDVYDQEADYHSAIIELNRYMGSDLDTLLYPSGDWSSLTRDFCLDSLLAGGLEMRKDLMAAAKNVEVGTREYELTRAERRPDVDLSLSYGNAWGDYAPFGKALTLGVSIPLPFANANKGEVKAARARRRQAELEHQDMELQVRAEITQAWYAFEAQKKKVGQYLTGVLDESRKVLEGMTYTYVRGEASIQDVLMAQRTYNDVCQEYLETMKGYVSSLVDLEHACGMWDIHF